MAVDDPFFVRSDEAQKRLPYPAQIVLILIGQGQARTNACMDEGIIANDRQRRETLQKHPMGGRKAAAQTVAKQGQMHRVIQIVQSGHAVAGQRRHPSKLQPILAGHGVTQKLQHRLLVIADQKSKGKARHRKRDEAFDHPGAIRAAVDVIAEKDQPPLHTVRLPAGVRTDTVQQLVQLPQTTMDIADGINHDVIRNAGRLCTDIVPVMRFTDDTIEPGAKPIKRAA